MPMSAPGSSHHRAVRGLGAAFGKPSRGFTLIELLIVVALVAVVSGLVSLAIRDPAGSRLEREAARLSALLESARAEARASGLAVRWVPAAAADAANAASSLGDKAVGTATTSTSTTIADAADAAGTDFRFVGLPAALGLPQRWLGPDVSAEIIGGRSVLLGPEPLIGAQRIVLRLADQRITLATDGLGPFAVVIDPAP
jgi:general secretion pathway protein H